MSLKNFRSYQLAVGLHQECLKIELPKYLRDQLLRASSSVALNLAEGSAKPTVRDRVRHYNIAFGSLREVQAILDLLNDEQNNAQVRSKADHVGACIYKLVHQPNPG